MAESLGHAVARMRAQGYDDAHIAGQIRRWHPEWSPSRVSSNLGSRTPAPRPPRPISNLGGTFTPGGFVPNKPRITLPTDTAPYRHGRSPGQAAVRSLGASGNVRVVDQPATNTDAQRYAQTKAAQRELVAHGYKIAVDGINGPQTQAAQRDYFARVARTGAEGGRLDASRQAGYLHAPTPQSVDAQVKAERQAYIASHTQTVAPAYRHTSAGFDPALLPGAMRAVATAHPDYADNPALLRQLAAEWLLGHWNQGMQSGDLLTPAQQAYKDQQGTNFGKIGAAALAMGVESVPGVSLFGDYKTHGHTTWGGAINETINDVGWILPGVGKIVSDLPIAAAVTRLTGRATDEASLARAAEAASTQPIRSPIRVEIHQALSQTPNLSQDQVAAAMHLYDTAAYRIAEQTGASPQLALERVWSGARYSADHPELRGAALPPELHAQLDKMHSIDAKKAATNLRSRLNPANAEKGLPTYDVMSAKHPGIRILGRPSFDEWLTRINHSTPDVGQQKIDAAFYRRLEPVFQAVFGEGYMPVLRGFAASQANAGTADGLSSVLRAAERIERGAPVVNEEGGIASVVAQQIEDTFKGQTLTSGQRAKLSDFIDSIRGLKTREWMAHDPRGGAPAAGDVWSSRDMGNLDQKLVHATAGPKAPRRHELLVERHGVNLRDLVPEKGAETPQRARYERIQEFYTEMADNLNRIKYHGRDNWSPADAQAMGWASIQRFYGGSVEDVMQWVDSGIRKARRKIRFDQHAEARRHIAAPNGVHVLDRRETPIDQMTPHPDYLYHGTNEAGLNGILSEGKIRATPTERNPEDIRAWLTDHPARAAAQGRYTVAIPRKNLPGDMISSHPMGMYSSERDVPIFGSATDSGVVQLHSEADPYPDLHPQEHAGYQALSDAQKRDFAAAVDRAVEGSTFKSVLGLEDKGHHFGVGIWDGVENPGLGSHVAAPARITAKERAKYNALAAAQGMAKDQGSVSWGRPLPADARGKDVYPALLSRQPATGALGAHVDELAGHGMVGVIHGPENSTYLVDFTGGGFDLQTLDPAGTPIKWQGGYVHDERLPDMASPGTPTFQEAIDAAPNAPMLKNAIEHTNAVVKNIQDHFFALPGAAHRAQWDKLLEDATRQMGDTIGARGLTPVQRTHAENYLIEHLPEEYANQFYDLMEAAGQSRNATDPGFLFADNEKLLGSIERAQGITQILRQKGDFARFMNWEGTGAAARELGAGVKGLPAGARQTAHEMFRASTDELRAAEDVKGAVVRGSDLRHKLLLTPKSDASTVVHELLHAMWPYLGHISTDEETLARSFEAWVMEGRAPTPALQPTMDTLAKGLRDVYGDARAIPQNALTPELRAHFENFFRESHPYKVTDVTDGNARTLWHTGGETTVGKTETLMGTGGAPAFHMHVHDAEGNLVAAQHGFLNPADNSLYASSVYVKPEHRGQGISSLLHGKVMDYAEQRGIPASAVFKNTELRDRTMGQAAARGREAYTEPGTSVTYFQREHSSHWTEDALKLADEHGVDIADVTPTGEGGRVTQADVEQHIFDNLAPKDQLRALYGTLKFNRAKTEAGYLAERSARFGQVRDIYADEKLLPREKHEAVGAALSGELPKVIIGGKARSMTQGALDDLIHQLQTHAMLSEGQKYTVSDALIGLIEEGRTPTRKEIELMQNVWGKDTVSSLDEFLTKWQKYYNLGLSALNVPRSIMSSMDVSFGLRQALVAGAYDPKLWARAWKDQWNYLSKYTGGGEAAYQTLMKSIHESPNFPLYQRMKLSITDMEREVGLREEGYQSNLAEQIPVAGSFIRSSGRMYTGMAVKLRTELADRLLADAVAAGRNVMTDDKLLEELGHFVNGITGRGDLPTKVLKDSAPLLNTLFFSPRLLASRLQLMNPRNYILGDKFVRQQYLKAGLRFYGTLATILATVAAFAPDGVLVGTNPRSSDFGKIKFANGTRIDLGGGFLQVFHLIGEIATGEKTSSTTGRTASLGSSKFGSATRKDAFIDFLSGKLAPVPAMINDWASNKDPQHPGEPFNPQDEALSHFVPLVAQDTWDIYNKPVGGMNGIAAAVGGYGVGATGVGMQTYQKTVPGKKSTAKYEAWAKATGVTIPPAVKVGMTHLAALKSITTAHPKDAGGAMKEMIAYYSAQTGKHDLDQYLVVSNETMQKRVMTAIRARMGGNASRYERAITARAKAKGLK